MNGANIFKFKIEELLRKNISPNWYLHDRINFEASSLSQITTRITKNNEFISVSLGNGKYPDDPIIRFTVWLGSLQYYDIQYLNGITLKFYSSNDETSYDIRPESLDVFLNSWAQILMVY